MSKFIDKLKNAWRSKTVWFNASAGIALAYSDQLVAALPQLQPILGANHYQNLMVATTVANVVLRFLTTHPLEAK